MHTQMGLYSLHFTEGVSRSPRVFQERLSTQNGTPNLVVAQEDVPVMFLRGELDPELVTYLLHVTCHPCVTSPIAASATPDRTGQCRHHRSSVWSALSGTDGH